MQRHLNKRKNQNTDRIVHGLANPTSQQPTSAPGALGVRKQPSAFEPSKHDTELMQAGSKKHLRKMKMLSRCQANFIQIILQKIDRRSKPIKKQEKELNQHLRRKKIYLDEEGWDILNLLKKGKDEANNGNSGTADQHNQKQPGKDRAPEVQQMQAPSSKE